MPYSTVFFDLDGTLYNEQSGVWPLAVERIERYMHEIVGIAKKEIPALRQEYLSSYGTSLRGLHIHYEVDPDDYLVYVHDIPIEEHLSANPELSRMLKLLPQKKWIFTNASRAHAIRVMEALQVRHHFANILDVKDMSYRSKPDAGVYSLALLKAGEEQASRCLMLDDRAENLVPAKALGMGTVLVGTREPHPAADRSIRQIEDLLDDYPELVE
jgi:putative hydrolase of the HAD superfamily